MTAVALPPNHAEDFVLPELTAYRVAAHQRRAAAMAAPHDIVAGLRLNPITPASYSRLVATGNAFASGTRASAVDVKNYVWFHWEGFTTGSDQADRKAACFAALARACRPGFRTRLYWYARDPRAWKSLREQFGARRFLSIVAEIREIWRESFADAAAGGGKYIGATLEAQFIHLFGHEFGWTEDRARSYPLRAAFQLLRTINAAAAGRDYVHTDAGEDAIYSQALAGEIAAAQAAHAARRLPANNPAATQSSATT